MCIIVIVSKIGWPNKKYVLFVKNRWLSTLPLKNKIKAKIHNKIHRII